MFKKIVSILSGIFNFADYVADYWSNNKIREMQKIKDGLEEKIRSQERTIAAMKMAETSKTVSMAIEHDTEMAMLRSELASLRNPNTTPREISG